VAGNDTLTLEAFKDANFNCPQGLNKGCESGNNCAVWGAPFIHNSHIGVDGICYSGNAPSVAACGQVPVDAQHRRLCDRCRRELANPLA